MAFDVATIGEKAGGYPVPQPGAICLVLSPSDGGPQLVNSDQSVTTLIAWLGFEPLVYDSFDRGGNWGTVMTLLAGEMTIWGTGPNQFITIWRETSRIIVPKCILVLAPSFVGVLVSLMYGELSDHLSYTAEKCVEFGYSICPRFRRTDYPSSS